MQDAKTDGDAVEIEIIGFDSPFLSHSELESDLARGVREGQFILHLQPIINLGNWSIHGMQVLLRWQHPQHGIIQPDSFIPSLEQSGMIVAVGQWVLAEACKLNRHWQDDGLPTVPIAIKVSGQQLADAGFVESVFDVLNESGLPPGLLVLELTETDLFTDTAVNIKLCNRLRDKGIRLALNYTANGYTSIEDISELPMDIIKLDKELIHHITSHPEQRAIMATILDFAHQNRLEVIAEGVETAEQLIFLNAMQCTAAQGFLLAHPLSTENFAELFHTAPHYEYIVDRVCKHWQLT